MKFRVKYLPDSTEHNDPHAKEEMVVVEASGRLEAAMAVISHYPGSMVVRVLTPGEKE